MTTLLVRRLLLLAYTLWVTSMLVFVIAEVVPGNVARTILGPFASQAAVDQLNLELGVDRPLLTRYVEWLGGLLVGDWGRSIHFNTAVLPLVLERTGRSLVLAVTSLVLLAPPAIALGVLAAAREGGLLDRIVSAVSLAIGAIPEFVTGVFLIVVLGLWAGLLPIQALPPEGAGLLSAAVHLVMPALCLVLLLFAYLFRVTRSSTIEVLASDATRTAVLKGLPQRIVLTRHVLPNALLPTITVLGTQLGWMVGGLVVVETLFRYPGLGSLVFFAATNKDVPLLVGCTMMIAGIYASGSLLADLAVLALSPRLRRRA